MTAKFARESVERYLVMCIAGVSSMYSFSDGDICNLSGLRVSAIIFFG